MEQRVPMTRKRRKRAHPTKCPCCSEERGKPEKEPRRKKREIYSAQVVDELVKSERLMEHEMKSKNIDTVSVKDEEEHNNERRVLRSGQSTPVSLEFELSKDKTVSQLDDTSQVNKKRLQNVGKKGKPTNKTCEQNVVYNTMSTNVGVQPVADIQTVKVLSLKSSRNQRKPANNKKKAPKKKLLKKTLKTGNRIPTTKKKALATEKLKIKSFDTLKEKMEKAFGKSSMSVPKCMELLGKITATHFKDIFRDDLLEGSGSDRDSTESSSEAKMMEGESEPTIESEAAKTLVSFKVQTTTSNGNSLCNQPPLSGQQLPSSKEPQSFLKSSYKLQTTYASKLSTGGLPLFASAQPLVSSPFPIGPPIANAKPYSSTPYNVLPASITTTSSTVTCSSLLPYATTKPFGSTALSAIVASSTSGTQVLPSIDQAFKKSEIQAVSAAPVVSPNVPVVQPPIAFHLSFQVSASGNSSNPSQTGPSNQFQPPPGFIYKKPVLNTLLPASTAKQKPSTLLPCPRLVYVTNVLPADKNSQLKPNFPGYPSGVKTEEHVFSTSAFPAATVLSTSTATNLVSSITPCSVSTTAIEVQSANKLRPILPREPFVAPTLVPVFGAGVPQSLQQIGEQSHQPFKKLVGDRVNDSSEVVTSLPDMASAFGNTTTGIITAIPGSSSQAPDGNSGGKQEHEMRSKEQAIKALLSIGGNSSVLSSPRKMEGLGNRPYDSDVSSELKVVFETDKGIFKVDDVTIDPQVNTLGKESYTCGKCGKIFTSLSYLARHIKRVCPDMTHRKWKCNHCDKAFRHPFGLQQHVYTHTGERPHKCPQCPKAFYSSNDLRRHSRIHSGERPYICKHCGKSFATTISLKTHTFIHTGEKPHRCPHCTKTFATSSKLGRHIVTHSEQRPYPCQKCAKTFNRSGDLRRHDLHVHDAKFTENVGSPEKIYKCTECSSSFETAKQLGEHINEHTMLDTV